LVVAVEHLMALLILALLVALVVAALSLVVEAQVHLDKVILAVIPTELYLVAVAVEQERLVRLEQLYKRVLVALV
jgi:hypothetical protein